jgi:nucleoid-associated protein YgaU
MGFIDFVKSAGRKVGIFGERRDPKVEEAKAAAEQAKAASKAAGDAAARQVLEQKLVAADIRAAILSFVPVEELVVTFDGNLATVRGKAKSQSDREKAVLIAGNTEGVARVDDQVAVVTPEPPSVFHTVVAGDTLSEIAGRYYGAIRMFDGIFQANQPMLKHPDEIYPGQVLRIPKVAAPTHRVASGETLGTIAQHWYGDPKKYTEIAKANNLADPNKVEVGQELKIPLNPQAGLG